MSNRAVGTGATTITRAAANAAERYPDRVALRDSRAGEWRTQTFAEVGEIVDELALGLVARGLEPGDRISILANTRPEWTLASLAISRAGCVVVPMYPTNSPEECEWVAGNSGARMIICEDADQAAKIAAVRGGLERVETVALIDPSGGTGEVSLEQLRQDGADHDRAELERRCEAVSPEDPYTIIYTSGTTGPPKGAMLTHGNIVAAVTAAS